MIITSATPKELVNWFHARQEDQRVLCVMLATSQGDQRKISQLVTQLFEADAVLGNEVAFLLLHPGANTPLGLDKGYGEFATLRGSVFSAQERRHQVAYSLRDTDVFRDMSTVGEPYRQEIAEVSARAMALFVPDFMKLFGVSPRDLPALCVLIKGLDESIIFPLHRDWSESSLLALLGRIRSIADQVPNFRVAFQSLLDDIPSRLASSSDTNREIDAKVARITEILERLFRRYQGTDSDHKSIADFIARGCPNSDQLQSVLSRLSFCSNERYLKDGQVAKVAALMSRVDAVRKESSENLQSRSYILSIADRAKQLAEGRAQLFLAIQEVKDARIKTTSTMTAESLRRIRSSLEAINLAWDLSEKLHTAVECVRRLVGA